MTLPPHKIGDMGQRYEVRFRRADGIGRVFGWAETEDGAHEMAAGWRLHPETVEVWVADREAEKARRKKRR